MIFLTNNTLYPCTRPPEVPISAEPLFPRGTPWRRRQTETETTLTLEPPKPLQIVQPEQAAGLVPLKTEQKSQLEEKVDTFVAELVALDSNSPEFGRKVDQLTAMGRKEIAEAAGHSNRFLDRPVKAIDKDSGIGANLTELRKTVEGLDPGRGAKPRKLSPHPGGTGLRAIS